MSLPSDDKLDIAEQRPLQCEGTQHGGRPLIAHFAALAIMEWLHKAETDLVGSTVQLFNGDTGTVRDIKLDEHHGLCFTIDPIGGGDYLRRWYPVSTIRTKS